MAKNLNNLVALTLTICLIILAWIGFLTYSELFPANPATFGEDQITILTPKIKPLEELHFTLPVEKYGLYPARISSTLISRDRKKVYAMPPEVGALPPGRYDLTIEVIIPAHVDPGEYSLNRIYLYNVGRAVVVKQIETPIFGVVK
jgi:hypothetical protein